MLFDTHAHMNDPAFDPDREELLLSLQGAGVEKVMNVGCCLDSSKDCIAMAETYPFVYASVGSHPDSADEVNEEVIEEYRKLCQNEKIKAIGASLGYTADMKAYRADPAAFCGSVADVSMFLRVAVTGKLNSPDMYAVMQILGKERVCARINDMLQTLNK